MACVQSPSRILADNQELQTMNAKVVVEYTVENVCSPDDYGKENERFKTFKQVVKHLIECEGIFGIARDDYRIVSIKESK